MTNECFFKLLVHEPEKLEALCCEYLSQFSKMGDVEHPHEEVGQMLERLRASCSALVALSNLVLGHGGSKLEDVYTLTSSDGDGPSSFETTLAMAIGQNDHWQNLLDDTLKTGALAAEVTPEIQHLEQKLESPSPQDAAEALVLGVSRLPDFRNALRTGATANLERLLLQQLTTRVQNLLTEPFSGQVTHGDVEILSNSLDLFADYEGVADLQEHFMNWKASVAVGLSLGRLQTVITDGLEKEVSIELYQVLTETATEEYSDHLKNGLHGLALKIFNQFQIQARWIFGYGFAGLVEFFSPIDSQSQNTLLYDYLP